MDGLINNKLKKYKTQFIPVDSEHFSLWYGLQNLDTKNRTNLYSQHLVVHLKIHQFTSSNQLMLREQ